MEMSVGNDNNNNNNNNKNDEIKMLLLPGGNSSNIINTCFVHGIFAIVNNSHLATTVIPCKNEREKN